MNNHTAGASVFGVKKTSVVGGEMAAKMVARRGGGEVVLMYPRGCTLSRQKVRYQYEKDNICHVRTIERTVRNVRAWSEVDAGMVGEATIDGQTIVVECYGHTGEDRLLWYGREIV